ncbi:MAG: extracellular solute-binding protein [bacterium]
MLVSIFIGIIVLLTYFFNFLNQTETVVKKVTEIYFADDISIAHRLIIDKFNKKYEGSIKVIPIDLPFTKFSTNERKELLTRSLRSKSERIDVFSVDIIWVHRFAKWCDSLNKFLSPQQLKEFLPEAIDYCMYKNKLMAIPMYIDIGVLYYRDDLLKKLPDYDELIKKIRNSITYEEFFELGKRIGNSAESYYVFPGADYEGLICSYFELILNQDKDFFKGDKIDFTRPPARKALQLLYDLVNNQRYTPFEALEFTEHPARDYFKTGKSVFLRGWPGYNTDFNISVRDSIMRKNLKIGALPHFEGTDPAFVFGGWNLMVSKFSKHKNEVKKFIEFFISDEAQKILYEFDSCLPIKNNLYTDGFLEKHPELEYMRGLLKHGITRPLLEDYTRISDIVSYYVNKAMSGEISIDAALQKSTDLINSNKVIIK